MRRYTIASVVFCSLFPFAASAIPLTDDLQLELKPQLVSDY